AYSTLGRWFMPSNAPVTIDLAPHPWLGKISEKEVDVKASYPVEEQGLTYYRYAPHRKTLVTGRGADQVSFTNNWGFPDRDRFVDNRDGSLRILHVGSSPILSIQVRPFEKYNMLLEEELGLRTGRCVEVLTAGRDAGDMGANFRLVRDYGMQFKPQLVMIETV